MTSSDASQDTGTTDDLGTGGHDRNRRRLAWAVPVVVAGVVAGGFAISATSASGAIPDLPKRTAAQLITAVETSKTAALSGVVSETANLGLPSLPGSGRSSASLSWQTFVTGTHSAKVWIDGADKQRVALLGELSEADVVHNGNNVWSYTSSSNTVTHTVLPAHHGAATHEKSDPSSASPADLTPAAAADKLLAEINPTTAVSVDSARTVAGRAAYTLTLRPRGTGSTVSRVTIAIDAKKFVPLQVEVFGSGSSPAFRTGFTDISFATPSASTFDFVTPAGAKTTTSSPLTGGGHGEHRRHHRAGTAAPTAPRSGSTAKPSVIGSGWTSVLELPKGASSSLSGSTLNELTSPVGTSGQRVLRTALVNALVLPDGRTFVGAVTVAVLQHVAATTPR